MLIKISYVFFTLGINSFFVYGQLADQKSSFAFVIDDTGSMYNEIEQVKVKTELIFDKIVESGSSQIGNIILVTFNDPREYFFYAIISVTLVTIIYMRR